MPFTPQMQKKTLARRNDATGEMQIKTGDRTQFKVESQSQPKTQTQGSTTFRPLRLDIFN